MDDQTIKLLERASSYVDLNKSKFIRFSIQEKAKEIISEYEETEFGTQDWRMFFDMVEKPFTPTKRMKKAAAKYREIIANNEI